MRKIWAILLLTSGTVAAFGQSTFQEKKFSPSGKCGLKRFTLSTYTNQYKDPDLGQIYTKMAALVETTDGSCLNEYGVVQYIKGCVYEDIVRPNKPLLSRFLTLEFQGHEVFAFVHPTWEVDSTDADPLYYNLKGDWERTDTYLVPKKPLKLTAKTQDLKADYQILFDNDNYETYYFARTKKAKQFFVPDEPTGTQYAGSADNYRKTYSNLGFRTCVYKLKDIPENGPVKSFDVSHVDGGPIHCLEWDHRYDWDFSTRQFVQLHDYDQSCLEYKGNRIQRVVGGSH